tara:strand:- start:863 stop:1798 length:936 start_codon:yes stop_codon:yes gene_type:complete
MGFLDNSGDIILDAVLTDLGRKRLAEGNGRFRISKFAFGDDEIDYGLYDKNNTNGSAYFDINILQTPVLEAFTNNMSSMKSRLISYAENDLLYLPIILPATTIGGSGYYSGLSSYIVLVDETTVNALTTTNNSLDAGLLNGYRPDLGTNLVRTDQGLDTDQISDEVAISSKLLETQYFVQLDNRLGSLMPGTGNTALSPSSIDDDNIATYIVTLDGGAGSSIVSRLAPGAASDINGPRGTRTEMKIASSLDLKTSTFLFNQLGTNGVDSITSGTQTLAAADYKFIDSTLRLSGISTGYTVDIAVRFVKKTS